MLKDESVESHGQGQIPAKGVFNSECQATCTANGEIEAQRCCKPLSLSFQAWRPDIRKQVKHQHCKGTLPGKHVRNKGQAYSTSQNFMRLGGCQHFSSFFQCLTCSCRFQVHGLTAWSGRGLELRRLRFAIQKP